MVLTYHFAMGSQPSRTVYMFMKLNNIPFEEKRIDFTAGEHRSPEYRNLNPFMLVPVLDDDGFVLTESVAILKYLTVKYNVPEHWYPRHDLKQQAKIDEYMNWQHINIRNKSAMLFQNLFLLPMRRGGKINWEKVKDYRKAVTDVVHHLDTYFIKDKPYICGNDISLADLLAVNELIQLDAVEEDGFYNSNPNISAWVARVKSRIGPLFEQCYEESIMGFKQGYLMMKESREESKL